ncbi:hypothetical protein Tco_1278745 [Tanacetum coccineum]
MTAYEANQNNQNGNGNSNVKSGVFVPLLDIGIDLVNSYKSTCGTDAAYANDMGKALMKFQELILLCTKMVPEEEDRVEKFIGGLPDNIQGNVIATEPTRHKDAIRIANNLMDKKLKGCAARDAENNRRFDNNPRDNRVQQPPLKRQKVGRDYMVGNNKNKGYAGILSLCYKCKQTPRSMSPLDVETKRRLATKQETVGPLLRWHAMDVEEKDTPRGIAQN